MKRFAILISLVFFAEVQVARADEKPDVKETNKADVQADLMKGWDKVVFGKELDHEEYVKILGAVAASLAAENPAPVVGYTKEFVQQSIDGLSKDLKQDVILMALQSPDKVFSVDKWEVSAGFATYQHRKAVGTQVPDKVELDGLKITVRTKMVWAVTDLPNTFQPYVRLRLKK